MSRLTTRIRRLEETMHMQAGDSPCRTCGYPDRAVRVAFYHEEDAQAQCEKCHRELSIEGSPLHRDGIRAIYVRETCITS